MKLTTVVVYRLIFATGFILLGAALATSCAEEPEELPTVEVVVPAGDNNDVSIPAAEDTTPEAPGEGLSEPQAAECPEVVPQPPLECPEPVAASSCAFCTDQALGWMCQLPAGAPYDG